MSRHYRHTATRRALARASNLVHVEAFERRTLLSAPPTLGPELVLPGDTTPALSVGQQTKPSLAEGPDGVSLAVWQDTRSGGHPAVYFGIGLGTMTDIYAARVRADGSVIDVTPIPVAINSYNQQTPRAAWNGTNWLVAWSTERDDDRYETDIHAVRVSPDGVVLDPSPRVIGTHLPSPTSSDDIDPFGPLTIASNGSDWFVQWRRHNPNLAGGIGMEWFATRVTADGTVPDAQGVQLLSGNQYYSDFGIAFSPAGGGQFLHAYDTYGGGTFIQRFDANMNLIPGSQQTIAGTSIADVSLAGGPQGWLAAWEDSGSSRLHAVRIGADGAFIDTTPILIQQGGQVDFSLDSVWNGVNWTIAYSNYAGGGQLHHDIYVRRLEPTGDPSTALKPVVKVIDDPSHQIRPQLSTSDNGGYKMVYEDLQSLTAGVAVAVVSPSDVLLAQADASLAAPSQGVSELASDGTNFLMVFSSSTGFGTRLLGQRVNPQGQAFEQEPFVLADAAQLPGSYEVVYLNGRYVAIFNADAGPQGKMIYARTVETDGMVGAQVALMPNADFTGFSLQDASVNGDRVILVGNAKEGNAERSSRFGRVFDSNLAPVSERFLIGFNFALSGDTEAVNGGWITAWANKSTHDASRNSIVYARVDRDGQVTTPASNFTGSFPSNGLPTVVSNGGEAASEAMIVYPQSLNNIDPQIVNEDALRAQRVGAADGARIGGQITLIDEPQIQSRPEAVFDGTDYVLVWTDQRNYPFPAQGRDDIFGARVAVDGTVIDPGGFPIADSFRPELHGDVAVAGGQIMFAYRTFRHEAPWGSYRLAARGTSAAEAPQLAPLEAGFDFERDHAVAFVFNKPVLGADSGDLVLENLTTGQTVPASDLFVQTIPAGTSGWTYRWLYDGILADGNYRATLPAESVTDFAGRPLASDLVVNFHVLAGDANRDGRVNLDDFNILAANFGQSNRTFSQGDFSYDGQVNLDDFNILASRFGVGVAARGTSAPFAGARPGSSPASDDAEEIGLT